MLNDLHDMIRVSCEEAITPDIAAEVEFREEDECGPTYDEVADSYAADAWHDAQEYPEW